MRSSGLLSRIGGLRNRPRPWAPWNLLDGSVNWKRCSTRLFIPSCGGFEERSANELVPRRSFSLGEDRGTRRPGCSTGGIVRQRIPGNKSYASGSAPGNGLGLVFRCSCASLDAFFGLEFTTVEGHNAIPCKYETITIFSACQNTDSRHTRICFGLPSRPWKIWEGPHQFRSCR